MESVPQQPLLNNIFGMADSPVDLKSFGLALVCLLLLRYWYYRWFGEETAASSACEHENKVAAVLEKVDALNIRGDFIESLLVYQSFSDLLDEGDATAFYSTDDRKEMRYCDLKQVLHKFPITHRNTLKYFGPKSRIAVAVQNGPELSVLLLSVMNYYSAVPVNPESTASELEANFKDIGVKGLIVQHDGPVADVGRKLGIPVLEMVPSERRAGMFKFNVLFVGSDDTTNYTALTNNKDDIALILQTSGTSGKKKIVTYKLKTLTTGAACIIKGWRLRPSDICYNCMPLTHIGGIARNLIAVVLSGGAVVASPGFDATLFWDTLKKIPVTWYYSGPTQHQIILEEGKRRACAERHSEPLPKNTIRMIANAAGSLLPSLAEDMRRSYRCSVLPGYGMTECMPITCPPVDYGLEKPGTSGIPSGPDVAIFSENGVKLCQPGTVGHISVKGSPCFEGYETKDDSNNGSFFNLEGEKWFDTGDLGYLDEDGYLFISGRSKEVINRGGEIISPFEIEEVLSQHSKVKTVLVFSAAHSVLSETIGIWVVPRSKFARPSLAELQNFVKKKLHPSKWPQVLVICDQGFPEGKGAGKPLRVNLGERLKLPPIETDSLAINLSRTFEVPICPAKGAALDTAILCKNVDIDLARITKAASSLLYVDVEKVERTPLVMTVMFNMEGEVMKVHDSLNCEWGDRLHIPRIPISHDVRIICYIESFQDTYILQENLGHILHGYEVPCYVIQINAEHVKRNDKGVIIKLDMPGLPVVIHPDVPTEKIDSTELSEQKAVEDIVLGIWFKLLDGFQATSSDDFFQCGGTSLLAGQLAATVRETFDINFNVAEVFSKRTVTEMSGHIWKVLEKKKKNLNAKKRAEASTEEIEDKSVAWTSSNPFYLFLQFFPLAILYPLLKMTSGIVLVCLWPTLHAMLGESDLRSKVISLSLTMMIARIISLVLAPCIGILAKWVIVHRFRAGEYPMFGTMYLRRWLVNQILLLTGKGIFSWSSNGVCLYYRLLGAKIGNSVSISSRAKISEPDLLEIGDNVIISEDSYVRPFTMERSKMILAPIKLERGSCIGPKSTMAPGHVLEKGQCLSPLSSSYEVEVSSSIYRKYCEPYSVNKPDTLHMYLFGYPILFCATLASWIPLIGISYLSGLFQLDSTSIPEIILSLTELRGILFYFAFRITYKIVRPFFYFSFVVFVKRCIVGKFEPGIRGPKAPPRVRFNHWLMHTLLPDGSLGGVLALIGKHYDLVSACYRLLGASIGQRVYWPGSGFHLVEHDLLTIGDDVVFGSRSFIYLNTRDEAKRVVIGAGANVADRCILLPGSEVKQSGVVGTGSLIPEDKIVPPRSIWCGSVDGCAVMLSASESSILPGKCNGEVRKLERQPSSKPFGRAFWEHKAPYYVLREWQIILLHMSVYASSSLFWALPLALSLLSTSFPYNEYSAFAKGGSTTSLVLYFAELHFTYSYIFVVSCFAAIFLTISAKWTIIGLRRPGTYNWDESSYCQRWKLNLLMEEFKRVSDHDSIDILDLIRGTELLNIYFRLLGSKIGSQVCLYPNGGDPMMTEPELVEIHNNVTIDSAALISHLNSRGVFTLQRTILRNRCSLRNNSRPLSGSIIERNARLLEHTLVFQGERVKASSTVQGWPGKVVEVDQ